jgi:hypothetical protein
MRYLSQNANAAMLIGDRVVDLDSPVDRTRVQHDCVRLKALCAILG